jgi:hypothetical protein
LKNRSEILAGREQNLTILQGNSRSIAQKSGRLCTVQAELQPISFKSDRLLANGDPSKLSLPYLENHGFTLDHNSPFVAHFLTVRLYPSLLNHAHGL